MALSLGVTTAREVDSSASLPVAWWRRRPDTGGVETPNVAWWRAQPDPAGVEASRGTWFDEAVDLRDPEREALTKEVLALIAAVDPRTRKRRQTDECNHRTAVRRVLANGLRCHFFRRPALVAYLRKADGYSGGPAWLSGDAMSRTIDLLVKAGLLNATLGRWGAASSTYCATEKLCCVAQACGITADSLTLRLPPQRLVRLRKGGSGTPQIDFEPTADTIGWTDRLQAYNAFLSQQDIGLALTAEEDAEWVRHWNERREKRRSWEGEWEACQLFRPELIQTDLYRQFNGSFSLGGRLYGGWWINTPKALRQKVTINGQPTAELDFSGCAIRMLYHERGLDYWDDPYWLEDIAGYEAEMGLASGHFREGIKAITQALINDQGGKEPEKIKLPDGLSFRPRFKRLEIRKMIEGNHAPIADAFGTGAGLRLQRLDSDLALDIVLELMRQDVLALPIHDSFLVDRRHRFRISLWMTRLYRASG
jgi:hypothetical protein